MKSVLLSFKNFSVSITKVICKDLLPSVKIYSELQMNIS